MPFSPQTTEKRLNNLKGKKTMTKAQHTPGPWHYSPYPESSGFAIGAKGLRSVAITTGKSLDCLRDENEANARLIAAGPEMLAVLYDVMQCFVGDDENEVAQRARAAIAKATGE